MLNVKYVIQTTEEGQPIPLQNPNANGNAWFVSKVKTVQNADEEMEALDSIDSKNEAVVAKEFMNKVSAQSFVKDSLATITLEDYKTNYLKYTSQNTNKGLAVFSGI